MLVSIWCLDDKFLFNIVTGLTASQYMIQQDGLGERLIPAQIQIYPDQGYNDLAQRRTYNIYKFSKQRGEFQDYNIIPCFEETHLLHLLIKMDWRMDMDLMAIAELQRFARYSVRTTAKITSLRVQNIEVRREASRKTAFSSPSLFLVPSEARRR